MSHHPKPMTIGALAKASGVGIETVRFYQRRGLLEVPETSQGYRHYNDSHVERLRFIKRAQGIGFTLEEIAELLSLNDSRDHATARTLASEKLARIEQRIQQLQAMATALNQLVASCRHGGEGMPCPIIRLSLADDENPPNR